jgi:hypothetical protein
LDLSNWNEVENSSVVDSNVRIRFKFFAIRKGRINNIFVFVSYYLYIYSVYLFNSKLKSMTMRCVNALLVLVLTIGICAPISAQTIRNLVNRAKQEYELHAFNQAIETYKQVLERRPNELEALGNIADCYRHINDMMEAAKYYSRYIAEGRNQRNLEARHILNYAHVLKALGQYDRAKEQYLEYAKNDPLVGNHYAQSCDFAKSQLSAATNVSVNNERINSASSDFGPAFYRGQVVFSSFRVDARRGATFTGQQQNQLYVARPGVGGNLENPFLLRGDAPSQGAQQAINDGPVSFTADGRRVAFTRNNFIDGTRHIPSGGMQLNLFFADITETGAWTNVQPFPHNSNNFSNGFPYLSPDGNTLYFASDRPEGFGGYDIYVSYRDGGGWTRPENLGPVINTPGNEITPYLEGNTLFFASDWHPGFGGYDLFRAEQSANNRWVQIFHLGHPLSSSYDDYGLIYDNARNIGYFSSNRPGGIGKEDIYSFVRPSAGIVLTVTNASDGAPVPDVSLDLNDCRLGLARTDQRGVYQFQAVRELNCEVIASKSGYLDNRVRVSAAVQQGQQQINVQLIRRGEEYYGKVVNYATRLPVSGVLVAATNQSTGAVAQTTTDRNGDYGLALSPNTQYNLRYSAPGFRDVNRTVRTQFANDPALLGSISILPSDSPLPPGQSDPSVPIEDPYRPPAATSGFAVQIAALSRPSTQDFSNLRNYGLVYTKEEDGRHKIRVGVFATREEAQRALPGIRGQGFPGAFVVAENNAPIANRGGQQFVPPPAQQQGYGRYKVQLGAYRDTRNFNDSRISNLGYIEDRMKGNLTIKLLAGFDTVEEARNALRQARNAGFTTAFIVMEESGELRRVQ